MKRMVYFIFGFVWVACNTEPPTKNQLPEEAQTALTTKLQQEISGFAAPEGIVADAQYIYVSNVGEKLAPTEKDGDGFISRLDKLGQMQEQQFIAGLHAPKGMVIQQEILYVADVDRVKGFQLPGGEPVFDLDFSPSKANYLNDLAVDKAGNLLVSATNLGQIFRIDTEGEGTYSALEVDGDLSGVNGLFFDRRTNQLFVNSYGKNNEPNGALGVMNLGATGTLLLKRLGTYEGYLDGLLVLGSNLMVFTDWKKFEKAGELLVMDLLNHQTHPFELSQKIAGPADFYFDPATKILWMPMMMENKVLMEQINL
ncbi:MAG: hypothetical protein AAGD05_00845 [Bacteroidota bacterium]